MPSPFVPKNWENKPSTATPLTEGAIEDLEIRVTDFAYLVGNRVVTVGPLSGSNSLDCAQYPNNLFICTFSGNTTLSGFTNMPVGGWAEIVTTQPGSPVSITLPSALTPGDVSLAVTSTAGAVDRFGYSYLGGLTMHGFVIGNDIR